MVLPPSSVSVMVTVPPPVPPVFFSVAVTGHPCLLVQPLGMEAPTFCQLALPIPVPWLGVGLEPGGLLVGAVLGAWLGASVTLGVAAASGPVPEVELGVVCAPSVLPMAYPTRTRPSMAAAAIAVSRTARDPSHEKPDRSGVYVGATIGS